MDRKQLLSQGTPRFCFGKMLDNVIQKYDRSELWLNTHVLYCCVICCLYTPAFALDTFFRVNLSLSMTGSPTKPEEVIEKWVRDSHDCRKKLFLQQKRKCVHTKLFSFGKVKRTAGAECHHGSAECHHKGECRPVGHMSFKYFCKTKVASYSMSNMFHMIFKLWMTYCSSVIFHRNMANGLMVRRDKLD